MRVLHVAYTARVPVVEQQLSAFEVFNLELVLRGSDFKRGGAGAIRNLVDGIHEKDVEQEVGSTAFLCDKLEAIQAARPKWSQCD